jgi:hypothetical protein
MIRRVTQMLLSKDEKVRNAMRWFTENQQFFRCIEEDIESGFLNWKDEHGEAGTTSLTVRTRKTCQKLGPKLKLIEEEMVVKTA